MKFQNVHGIGSNGNGTTPSGDGACRKLHAVVVPFPAQGHVTPALQLAKKLVKFHGFRVTFVNTTYIHERVMKFRSAAPDHEGIEFVHVSDGLPDSHPRLRDLTTFCNATLQMGPVFKALFAALLARAPITLVIRDTIFAPVYDVAKSLGLPVATFVTSSAVAMHCFININTLVAAGVLPVRANLNDYTLTLGPPESDAEVAARNAPLTALPGSSPTMRVQDLPTVLLARDMEENFFIRFFRDHQNPKLADSDCLVYNSFRDLEGPIFDATVATNPHVFAVGPLVLETESSIDEEAAVALSGSGSALWEEDPIAVTWLDKQKPRSVLFVSFGSIVTASVEQMREFALGLESSNVAFLWVIRPDLIDDASHFHATFAEFVARTRHRSLLVPWAPQTAVLSHPATGAFLTHCGWNSTIESIASGVPMLVWPRLSDQSTNAHYIAHVWKIGFEMAVSRGADGGVVVAREEVSAKVRKIMAADGGEEEDLEVAKMRLNSEKMKVAARRAVGKGGSSQVALSKFVALMASKQEPDAPNGHNNN